MWNLHDTHYFPLLPLYFPVLLGNRVISLCQSFISNNFMLWYISLSVMKRERKISATQVLFWNVQIISQYLGTKSDTKRKSQSTSKSFLVIHDTDNKIIANHMVVNQNYGQMIIDVLCFLPGTNFTRRCWISWRISALPNIFLSV